MSCEHPACSLVAITICKHHCHLSLCHQHRLEHETNLLNEFEKQLDNLTDPVCNLLDQSRSELKQSEESRQRELDRINSLLDRHLTSVDQRSKFSKITNELIPNKREQLIKYKNGDNQLTKEDYEQLGNLLKKVQANLYEQYELNNQIRNKNSHIHLWPTNQQNNASTEIECIELSDSEDDISKDSIDQCDQHGMNDTSSTHHDEILPTGIEKKRKIDICRLRHFCPLTQLGVFGLNSTHNLSRLCPKSDEKRYLYTHFIRTHRIKSSIACQLVKAIRADCDPMTTKILPQGNTSIVVEDIQCPFDGTMMKINKKYSIANTPCYSSLAYHCFKSHLRAVHLITKANTELIYNAMKTHGTISHIQFDDNLCEIK